jgi:hypothetical protein
MWPILKRFEFHGFGHRFIIELSEAGASAAHTRNRSGALVDPDDESAQTRR